MRHLITALVVFFSLSACKKDSAPASAEMQPPAASSDSSGSADEQVAEAPAAEEAEPEEAEVELTPELVAKYVEFQKVSVAVYQEELAKFKEAAKKAEDDKSLSGSMAVVSASAQLTETMSKRVSAAREAAGLTERQVDKLKEVVRDTVFLHKLALKNKPQMEQTIADMKKSLANAKDASPEQRAEIQNLIDVTEKGLAEQLNLTDARATHGDKSVEAVLAHEDALHELQQQASNLLKM